MPIARALPASAAYPQTITKPLSVREVDAAMPEEEHAGPRLVWGRIGSHGMSRLRNGGSCPPYHVRW